MAAKPKYEVLTWDMELRKWTPQQGVRRGPYTLWGLKRALQKLRGMGYGCEYSSKGSSGDPSVSVERIWTKEEQAERLAEFNRALAEGRKQMEATT